MNYTDLILSEEKNPLVCPVCSRAGVDFELDHMQPVARGGTNHPSNLWFICKECNRKKGVRTLYEFIVRRLRI